MPLDAPVMKTSGAAPLIAPPPGAADEGRARAALEVDDARQVVVLHALGANDALALGDDHRQVRAHPLDVAKRVQELAAELDLLFLAVRRPDDVRVAEQLHLAAVAVGERPARVGERDDAVAADGADARLVDLERVVVGKVAQALALDLVRRAPSLPKRWTTKRVIV